MAVPCVIALYGNPQAASFFIVSCDMMNTLIHKSVRLG